MTMTTALPHIGTYQPATMTCHLKTSRKARTTVTTRKIVPASKTKEFLVNCLLLPQRVSGEK